MNISIDKIAKNQRGFSAAAFGRLLARLLYRNAYEGRRELVGILMVGLSLEICSQVSFANEMFVQKDLSASS